MGFFQRWKESRTLEVMLREERPELAPEVSEGSVRNRMTRAVLRSDFQSLNALHGYFPKVDPDYDSVQRAYARHYGRQDLQSAHKLFDIFGIEPDHKLSERVTQILDDVFNAVVVNKEVKKRVVVKDKYVVTFHLPDQDVTFRRKVSPQEFYNEYQIGSSYQLSIPILQRVNMLGHQIGQPYISPSNLLFG